MTVSTDKAAVRPAAAGAKDRPAREVVVRAFFGPLAHRLAVALRPLRVPAPTVVLANGVAGIAAAVAIEQGSLVAAANTDRSGVRLLKGVIDLCRAVELPCIAEHVETEQQVGLLRDLGCRFGQGYWLARPMSAEKARHVAQSDLIAFAPLHSLKKLTHRAG